jgi:hypothetical protein
VALDQPPAYFYLGNNRLKPAQTRPVVAVDARCNSLIFVPKDGGHTLKVFICGKNRREIERQIKVARSKGSPDCSFYGRHSLDELMSQCDPDAAASEEEKVWDQMPPAGRDRR